MLIFSSEAEKKQPTDSAALDRLIERIAEGDSTALEQLYGCTRAAVYGFALSVLKNPHDAEDALHDCYVAVWNGAAQYRSHGKPMAWLLTVTKNLCLGQLRTRKKAADAPSDAPEFDPTDSAALTPEDRTVLAACMRQLSDAERQIVMLHAVAGFKHREIAAFLKVPLSTVLSKYNRALKKLKEQLQ